MFCRACHAIPFIQGYEWIKHEILKPDDQMLMIRKPETEHVNVYYNLEIDAYELGRLSH